MPNPEEKNAGGSFKRTYQGDKRLNWLPDNNGVLEIPFRFRKNDCKFAITMIKYIKVYI